MARSPRLVPNISSIISFLGRIGFRQRCARSSSDIDMPGWVLIWIERWASGEKFRKATPEDYRRQFGMLFASGLFMIVTVTFGFLFMEQAKPITLGMTFVIVGVVVIFGGLAWSRVVP